MSGIWSDDGDSLSSVPLSLVSSSSLPEANEISLFFACSASGFRSFHDGCPNDSWTWMKGNQDQWLFVIRCWWCRSRNISLWFQWFIQLIVVFMQSSSSSSHFASSPFSFFQRSRLSFPFILSSWSSPASSVKCNHWDKLIFLENQQQFLLFTTQSTLSVWIFLFFVSRKMRRRGGAANKFCLECLKKKEWNQVSDYVCINIPNYW